MFSFPNILREHNLDADVRTLLDLYEAMNSGLIHGLGSLYTVGRTLIVKEQRQYGPYTFAFLDYFLGMESRKGDNLNDVIARSKLFRKWVEERPELREGEELSWYLRHIAPEDDEIITRFLGEVLVDDPSIQKTIMERPTRTVKGREFDKGRFRGMPDDGGITDQYADAVGDHRDISLDQLLEQLEEIREWQEKPHTGGGFVIGTQGISPYGHSGRALGGIRIGGQGIAQQARMVIDDPRYNPVNTNALVSDDNIDAALAALKGVPRTSEHLELDIPKTIREGTRRAGLFLPVMRRVEKERTQVILLIDNGGYSMSRYTRTVTGLFKKMKTRFTHDLKVFYFHNCIKGTVYTDKRRTDEPIPIEKVLDYSPEHSVFVVGDAAMASYELLESGWNEECAPIEYLRQIGKKFPKFAWLNPRGKERWGDTRTIVETRGIVEMFPLTPRGIEKSVQYMNGIR
jgi:uncharacterized protein